MRSRSALSALLLVPVLLAPHAHAFGVLPGGDDAARWPSRTVSFELDEDGVSTIDDGSDVEAVRRAVSSIRRARTPHPAAALQ